MQTFSGGSPGEIWHVGTKRDRDLASVGHVLVKSVAWPFDPTKGRAIGFKFYGGNTNVVNLHIVLARAVVSVVVARTRIQVP